MSEISIHGARHHNLKNISLAIPRGKFVKQMARPDVDFITGTPE